MVENFTRQVRKTTELLKALIEFKEYFLTNWKPLTLIISSIGIIYLFFQAFSYLTYQTPQQCINDYFSEISKGNYDNAWDNLSEKFQNDKFKNNKEQFRKTYATTRGFTNIAVNAYNFKGLISDFFSDEMYYDVSYEVEDNIKKENLSYETHQKLNTLWVQVKEEKSLSELEEINQIRFTLRRIFTHQIKVIKEHGDWKISQIKTTLTGLKKD